MSVCVCGRERGKERERERDAHLSGRGFKSTEAQRGCSQDLRSNQPRKGSQNRPSVEILGQPLESSTISVSEELI